MALLARFGAFLKRGWDKLPPWLRWAILGAIAAGAGFLIIRRGRPMDGLLQIVLRAQARALKAKEEMIHHQAAAAHAQARAAVGATEAADHLARASVAQQRLREVQAERERLEVHLSSPEGQDVDARLADFNARRGRGGGDGDGPPAGGGG